MEGYRRQYKDRYRAGWDALRAERFGRMNKDGLVDCSLSALQPEVFPRRNLPEEKCSSKIGPGAVGGAPFLGIV